MDCPGPDGTTFFVSLNDNVYRPGDDSFLLAKAVAQHVGPGTRFLEVGCGTGYVSLVAARAGAAVTCTDMNPRAVALARHNARENQVALTAVETDLLAGLPGPFDVVAFNPPYLPTAREEYIPGPLNLAFDGGLDGNQVVLRFAEQLGQLRPLAATVLVVHSSLSDPAPFVAAMRAFGYRDDVVAEESHFYERLTVRRFQV